MTATATTVEIAVTQRHIDHGKPGWCGECPIALAILDAMPGVVNATVFISQGQRAAGAFIRTGTDPGDAFSVALPPEAFMFISDFDNGDPVVPFTFPMEVTR